MDKVIVGVDNGVSGGLAFIDMGIPLLFSTPVFETFGYQKVAKKINRLDHKALSRIFETYQFAQKQVHFVIERPMVMPARFDATVSALRCYEAFLVTVETYLPQASYETVDSKAWQKVLLPTGIKGPELKKASMQRGIELFPSCAEWIRDRKDADPLLIMEWARRRGTT